MNGAIRTEQSPVSSFAGETAPTGSLLGAEIGLLSASAARLADSNEEMTFMLNRSDAFALKDRRERQSSMTERMRLFREKLVAARPEAVEKVKEALLARADQEEILRLLGGLFSHPAEAWAALDEARRELLDMSSLAHQSGAAGRAASALETLEKYQGGRIRAGVQGALAAVEFGEGPAWRDIYTTAVCDAPSPADLLLSMEREFPGDFRRALAFLYKALALDMACDAPSHDKVRLEHVNHNLGQLRGLQSLYAICRNTSERWQENVIDPADLMRRMLGMASSYPTPASMRELVDLCGSSDATLQTLFLQEILSAVRASPPSALDGISQRMRLLEAVQRALDDAVLREDAFLLQRSRT